MHLTQKAGCSRASAGDGARRPGGLRRRLRRVVRPERGGRHRRRPSGAGVCSQAVRRRGRAAPLTRVTACQPLSWDVRALRGMVRIDACLHYLHTCICAALRAVRHASGVWGLMQRLGATQAGSGGCGDERGQRGVQRDERACCAGGAQRSIYRRRGRSPHGGLAARERGGGGGGRERRQGQAARGGTETSERPAGPDRAEHERAHDGAFLAARAAGIAGVGG